MRKVGGGKDARGEKTIPEPESALEPGEVSVEDAGRSLDLEAVRSQVEDLVERYEISYDGEIGEALEKLLEPVNEDDRYRGHFMDTEELARYFDSVYHNPGVNQLHR